MQAVCVVRHWDGAILPSPVTWSYEEVFQLGKMAADMTHQVRVIIRMQEMDGKEDIPEKFESQIHVMYGLWLWFTLTLSYRNHEPKNIKSDSEGMKHEGF